MLIDSFVDKGEIIGANNAYGMVLTKSCIAATLAHECGHLFGMQDIYIEKESVELKVETYEKVSFDRMPRDWNGGCVGRSNGGTRYYKSSTSMQRLIPKMLMYGVTDVNKRDISMGSVYGLWYEIQDDGSKIWHKELAPTGWGFENKEQINFCHN